MIFHKDAWGIDLSNRNVYKAGKRAERSVGPDEYAVGTHHVKIDNIKSKLFVDGEAVLDLPKGKAFRLGVATNDYPCKLRLGSVKTEETTGACLGGGVVCRVAFSQCKDVTSSAFSHRMCICVHLSPVTHAALPIPSSILPTSLFCLSASPLFYMRCFDAYSFICPLLPSPRCSRTLSP